MNQNIRIVGTSHIAKQSISRIRKAFEEFDPDIVAIELDPGRLQALLDGRRPNYSPSLIKEVGLKGYLFVIIGGYIQEKLGDMVGVKPGSDMLSSVKLARKHSKAIALIDRDIRITLRRLSVLMGAKEKWRLVWDLISSPFSKKMKIDLSKIPQDELIETALTMLEKRYPGMYGALVGERNQHMHAKIVSLAKNYPEKKVLVVVGAGHVKGLTELLSTKDI